MVSPSRALALGFGLVLASLSLGCAGEAPVDQDPIRDGGAKADAADDTEPPSEDAGEDTEPSTDAGGDAGEDAGTDTEPASDSGTDGALDCTGSEKEPNNSIPSGVLLKTINDCDGSGSKFSGVVAGGADVDYWNYEGTDGVGCVADPSVKNNSDGVRVCVFVSCKSGATKFEKCHEGTPDSIAGGALKGCCVTGKGEASVDYTCTLVGTSDTADVHMRVDAPGAAACLPYSVDYHF